MIKEMNQKIVFVEPYVSFGGHNWKHLTLIPSRCKQFNLDYSFITEEGVSLPSGENPIEPCLTNFSRMQLLDKPSYLERRKSEFRQLLERWPNAIFIFLTTFEEDFEAWLALLKADSFRHFIQEENLCIIIQNTADLYTKLADLSSEEKAILQETKKHLFFSFYTELQATLARNLVPEMSSFHLQLPVQEDASQIPSEKPSYLSYLGRYEVSKGPHHVFNAACRLKEETFLTHFYPITGKNVLFYLSLLKETQNTKIYTNLLSKEQYLQIIQKTKIGFVPYDAYQYSIRASGIFEEFALAGVPTIVPRDSWMSLMQEKYQAGGASFSEKDPDDFFKNLESLLANYDQEKRKSLLAREVVHQKMSFESFLKAVGDLNHSRVPQKENQTFDEEAEARVLQKGKAFYLSEVALSFIKKGNKSLAEKFLQQAIETDRHYWRAQLLLQHTSKTKKNTSVDQQLTQNQDGWRYLPISVFEKFPQPSLKRKIKELLRSEGEAIEKEKGGHLLLGLLYKNINEIDIAKDYLKRYFGSLLQQKHYPHFSREMTTALNAIGDSTAIEDVEFSKLLHSCLSSLAEVNQEKKPHELYAIASLNKRFGNHDTSKRLFSKVIQETTDISLHAKAFFHMGEVDFLAGDFEKAKENFEACISINPMHQMAQKRLTQVSQS